MPFVNASLSQHANVSDISKMPKLSEWHIYGNEQQGRFVTRKPDEANLYYLDALTEDVIKKNFKRILDKKQYELKDHLGNVRVAIGDMKIPTVTRGQAPFVVDEKAVNDYYPYGMLISDRSWSSGSSRYGYNGKEMDNELKGTGNSLDFGDRIFDPRIIRFPTPDKLKDRFAFQSSYVYANNNPIWAIDKNGNNGVKIIDQANKTITVLAVYVVSDKYTKQEVEKMNCDINGALNNELKCNIVTEGEYAGYKVKFDLKFVSRDELNDGEGNIEWRVPEKDLEVGDFPMHGTSIENSFTKSDAKHDPQLKEDKVNHTADGGYTTPERDAITMNKKYDVLINQIHEIFHTLFFDNDKAKEGIGAYYGKGVLPIQSDINKLINNSRLRPIPEDQLIKQTQKKSEDSHDNQK
ncbi:MAG: hypothetical protein NTW25_15425 [Candidatus Kapabacteria bacterium]|nr:hypothetical protein [Candidatus Kapabacteria bacterium]